MSLFSKLIFSPRRAFVRLFFIGVGVFLLLWDWKLDFFSPSTPKVVLLVDNSLSMLVQDIPWEQESHFINRFEAAKNFSQKFSQKSVYDIGIFAFSKDIVFLSPFSFDKNLQKNIINSISVSTYGWWSDVFLAIERVLNLYKNTYNLHIITITDAEFFEKNEKKMTNNSHANIWIVGVWTEKWWPILKWYDPAGKPIYHQFQWKEVISLVSKQSLQEISEFFSGKYVWIQNEKDIDGVVDEIFAKIWEQHISLPFLKILWVLFLLFGLIFSSYIPLKNYEK